MEPITVGQLGTISLRTATDTDKESHALQAAQAWIRTQSTILVLDPDTNEQTNLVLPSVLFVILHPENVQSRMAKIGQW